MLKQYKNVKFKIFMVTLPQTVSLHVSTCSGINFRLKPLLKNAGTFGRDIATKSFIKGKKKWSASSLPNQRVS